MKIKRVEIIGFKSFVEKVSLEFQEGITAILGPNGCGKSNVVDAIRWVMGEQNAKNLRGRSMEDVIFGGSETRKPLGMAEVSLTFCNSDGQAPPAYREYAEIMVTRRLYRNGESEFAINKTPCRLKDITELFMDTGVGARAYSIIEQGKIGMILNAKAEDRRFLIEEAAGVTKYKARKKSALRKIDATRQNLIRLTDIINEIRRQLNSLKRQAQKAERYREYRDEAKQIETRLARRRFSELQETFEAGSRLEAEQERSLEKLKGALDEQELKLEELKITHLETEKVVAGGQERVFHLTSQIQQVEGRLEFDSRERQNLDQQKDRIRAEQQETAKRLAELEGEEQALTANAEELRAELAAESRSLSEGETALEELASVESEASGRLESSRSNLFSLLTELSRLASRHDDAVRRLEALDERTSRNRQEAVSLAEQLDDVQSLMGEIEMTRHGVQQRQGQLRNEQEELQESIRLLRTRSEQNESALLVQREELSRTRSRLESLQELERNLEGYGSGVRAVLKEASLKSRFLGMVADGLDVPAEYEVAVEAALGDRLQGLLVEDVAAATAALDFLRSAGGRGTFVLPGKVLADLPRLDEGQALLDLIAMQDALRERLTPLLQGVFLVPDIVPWLQRELPFGVLLVSPGGETLSWRGDLNGGASTVLDQGVLHKKREIKDLSAQVEQLTIQVADLQRQREEIRADLARDEERLREVGAALHQEELKVRDAEKDLSRLRLEADRLTDRTEVLSLEEDQLHEERDGLDGILTETLRLREAKEQEKGEFEELVARLQEELQVHRRDLQQVRDTVTGQKVRVASLRERETALRGGLERMDRSRKDAQQRLLQLEKQLQEASERQETLFSAGTRLNTELEVLYHKREEEKERFQELKDLFDAEVERLNAQEEVLKGLRSRVNQSRDTLSSQQLQNRETSLDLEHLRQAFMEKYRLDLLEVPDREDDDFDAEAAEQNVLRLRKLIDEMGEVNLTALDDYRELDDRFQFLTSQQDDLRRSLDDLQKAIAKMNRTTRKRFRETFDLVNAKFQEVFPRLFRGGKAELKLTDENDLLETGIDIAVQPPGKKLQNVTLLSGGEKALTAVALIFSIFLIKPSPFCMLDEVDAPLDDANIGRFNEIVKEMSALSQFIIITHNKRTMEIADILYGVTMEEPGVSRFVSVRLNEF